MWHVSKLTAYLCGVACILVAGFAVDWRLGVMLLGVWLFFIGMGK